MFTDKELLQDVIDWIPEKRTGYFGNCMRCNKELSGMSIKYWYLIVQTKYSRGHRYLCEDCGNMLIK